MVEKNINMTEVFEGMKMRYFETRLREIFEGDIVENTKGYMVGDIVEHTEGYMVLGKTISLNYYFKRGNIIMDIEMPMMGTIKTCIMSDRIHGPVSRKAIKRIEKMLTWIAYTVKLFKYFDDPEFIKIINTYNLTDFRHSYVEGAVAVGLLNEENGIVRAIEIVKTSTSESLTFRVVQDGSELIMNVSGDDMLGRLPQCIEDSVVLVSKSVTILEPESVTSTKEVVDATSLDNNV